MNRRRFLLSAGLACLPLPAAAAPVVTWRGTALGAAALLRIAHNDPARAQRVLHSCTTEIRRLEGIFSLYRKSALTHANAAGRLDHPPADLVAVLSQALGFAELTGGAFDPTIQPLWEIHAAHFSRPDANPDGPDARTLARVLKLVGWQRVDVSTRALTLAPGTRLSLNGIAQGWITDRLVDLLRNEGLPDVLVNAGEIRAEGSRQWTTDRGTLRGALAISSPDGTRFSPACHHLFDPRTGRSSHAASEVAVEAPTATLADMASTAIAVDGMHAAARLGAQLAGVNVRIRA